MPWTPDLADTWTQAYGFVAKVMVAAAEQMMWTLLPAYWEADVAPVTTLGRRGRCVEVAPREPLRIRDRADERSGPR